MRGGGVRETREEGKRCSRAAPNPTSWIQKGNGKRKEKGERRKEKDRRERGRKKERKRRGKRGFLQKK